MKEKKMKHKNESFFYLMWGLNFLLTKCPLYCIYRLLISFFGAFIGILDLYMIRFAVNSLYTDAKFSKAVIYLLILTFSYILYLLLYEFISVRAAPYFEYCIKNAINKKIYKKTIECDYACYEIPSFFEQYILSASEAPSMLTDFLYTCTDLTVKIIELLFAGTLTVIIDSITMFFALLPFMLVPFYTKLSELRHQLRTELNNENRKKDYVCSTFFDKRFAKDIRLTSIFKPLINMYEVANKNIKDIYQKTGRKKAILNIIVSVLQLLFSQFIIMAYIAYRILISQTMLLGDGLVLVSVVETIYFSIDQILINIKEMKSSTLMIGNLYSFLNNKPTIYSELNMEAISGDIEFRNVSFKYSNSETNALDDISFSVKKGEKIAIVGENGSGKSTLMKLLLRLYDPNSGEIVLNNNNIKYYSIQSYRKLFSEVFQDYHIFSFSIRENIQKDDKMNNEKVHEAIIQSHFDSVLENCTNKEETIIGKEFVSNGVVLSGGQRQKLALAAAYYKDADYYLFDEPTSALDPEAEAIMFNDMFNISRNKTIFFCSHRLSSARLSDKILFLKNGKILESGTFDELMDQNGEFAHMFKLQASNYSSETTY